VPEVKTFDHFRPSWEYLQSCPKYATITTANVAAKKKKMGRKKLALLMMPPLNILLEREKRNVW
jgi:hypothetical protein